MIVSILNHGKTSVGLDEDDISILRQAETLKSALRGAGIPEASIAKCLAHPETETELCGALGYQVETAAVKEPKEAAAPPPWDDYPSLSDCRRRADFICCNATPGIHRIEVLGAAAAMSSEEHTSVHVEVDGECYTINATSIPF